MSGRLTVTGAITHTGSTTVSNSFYPDHPNPDGFILGPGASLNSDISLAGAMSFSIGDYAGAITGTGNVHNNFVSLNGSGTVTNAFSNLTVLTETNATTSFGDGGVWSVGSNVKIDAGIVGQNQSGESRNEFGVIEFNHTNTTPLITITDDFQVISKLGTGDLHLDIETDIDFLNISGGTLTLAPLHGFVESVTVTGAGTSLDLSAAGTTYWADFSSGFGSTLILGSNMSFGTPADESPPQVELRGNISGNGSLEFLSANSDPALLAGQNTYSGSTIIHDRSLTVSGGSAIPDTSAVLMKHSSALLTLQSNETIGSLATNNLTGGSVVLGANTLTTGGDDTSTTFSGVISGAGGSLIKAGTGTLTLTGENTYTGGTTINAGTLSLGHATDTLADAGTVSIAGGTLALGANSDTVGTVNLSSGSITGSGTLTGSAYNLTNTGTVSAKLGGSSALTKSGAGNATLSNTNAYSGGTTINAGTLTLGHATDTLADAGTVTIAGGTLALGANSDTVGTVNLSSGSITAEGGTLTGSAYNFTNAGTVSAYLSGSAALTKSGAGTVTLSGSNDYTGITTIYAGTLLAQNSGLSANSHYTVESGAVLELDNQYEAVIGGLTGSGSVNLNANDLTIGPSATDSDFAGTLSGSGNLTVNSASVSLSGSLSLTGALSTTGNGASLAIADGAFFTNNNTFYIGENSNLYIQRNNALSLGGEINLGENATLNVSGTGMVTLSGGNASTAASTIYHAGSTLRVNDANSTSFQNSIMVMESGATLDLADTVQTFAKIEAPSGSAITLGSGALVVAGSAASTVGAPISGTGGSLTISGSGTTTLSGSNSYTGGTTINAGTVSLGHATNTLADTGAVSIGGGTLALGANSDTVGTVNLSSGSITGSGTLTGSAYNLTDTGNVSANLSGSAALTKSGAGTATLSGANTYSGGTHINAGTLSLGSAGVLGSEGTISFGGGTLQYTAANTTDYSSRFSTADNQAFNIDAADQFVTLASDLSSTSGSLTTHSGIGILTLSGTNTYGGDTTISSGNLQLGNGGTTGSVAGDIVNNGTLIINRADDLTMNNRITGTGILAKYGNNILTVTETEHSGQTNAEAGTLRATGNGLSADSTYEVFNGATLDIATGIAQIAGLRGSGTVDLNSNLLNIGKSGVTTSFDGTLSGDGHISVNNGGQFVISGAQTLTGTIGTFGANSVLSLDDDASFAANNTFDINDNSIFSVQRSNDLTLAGNFRLKDSAQLHKLGTGVLTLSGSNSNSEAGVLDLEGGTLRTTGSSGGMFQNASVEIESGATLDLANTDQSFASFNALSGSAITLGSGQLTVTGDAGSAIAGTLSGTNGSLVKQSTGTLALTGAASHTGGTTITAGSLVIGNGGTTGSVAGNIVNNANLTFDRSNAYTQSGDISGNGSITQSGSGTTTLSGTNTYSGATTINAGAINLTGSAANSAFAINNGGILSGTGTLGSLTVNTGGILAPGNSPGTLSAGDTVWAGDASFILELDNATGTKGSNWDLLAITGTLTINATAANPFTINVDTLLNGTDTAGAMDNFDANSNYAWTFVETSGGIAYGASASIGASFVIDSSGFTNATNGTFSVTQIGNNLALAYTASAVPEPGSFALLLGALALGFTATRRRRG